jgi:hypothetical protein
MGLSTKEMVTELNKDDSLKKISLKTVQDLTKELREQEEPWIEMIKVRDGINKYKLIKQDKSNNSLQYKSETLQDFKEWLPIIETYDYIPFLKDIQKLIKEEDVSPFRKKIIDFPKTKYLGVENIMDLYNAIKSEHPIEFNYNSFSKPNTNVKLLPYIIKEHKGRWYLIGRKNPRSPFEFYAIDRITADTTDIKSSEKFNREENKLPKDCWKFSSGIYIYWKNTDEKDDSDVKEEDEPIIITFLLRDGIKFENVKYIDTKKLHKSQTIEPDPILRNGFEYFKVKLEMFPDADLIREIRRIGLHCIEDIKVKWSTNRNDPLPNLDKWIREL